MALGTSLETVKREDLTLNILLSKRDSRLEMPGSAAAPQSNYIKYLGQ